MTTLSSTINDLATKFAHELLGAIRTASIDELINAKPVAQHVTASAAPAAAAPSKAKTGKNGRLARRSLADIGKSAERIVAVVKATKGKGINAEDLRKTLKVDRRELPLPLALALSKKLLRKKGRKRATMYFVA